MTKLKELSADARRVVAKVCESCRTVFMTSSRAGTASTYCPKYSRELIEKSIDDNKFLDYEVER